MSYAWMLTPALVGMLTLVANVILGRQVLKRGVIFIDLAMAQIAALGVLWVELQAGHTTVGLWHKILASWVVTLPAALLLGSLERLVKQHLEAIIGLLYVTAACAAVVLVSSNPHGKELITTLLNGRLLWSSSDDIWPVALVTVGLVLVQIWRPIWLRGQGFYLLFALAIPPLVISLGVYLEFASLIIPALVVAMWPTRHSWLVALSLGLTGGIAGFIASLFWDYPIGPSVVLAMVVTGLIISAFNVARQKSIHSASQET
ncbi:metal ABC transporter permease [Vibrio nereis]|uniref:metal ABC transporter permease n=1 Tax=Vibrio nereis TaxID=693 RepID=UPI0024943C63|nr:metal ABC transporter permease [Vibrio nereis]